MVTRSKGETVFFGLGGKVEPGETELECLQREVREEVGCIAKNPKHFQTFEGQAHDPAKTIRTPCYLCELEGEIKPKAEIEEVAWIGKDYAEKGIRLAPMLKLHIVPTLIRHKLL